MSEDLPTYYKSRVQVFVIVFTFSLLLFNTTVQVFLVQNEIGYLQFFLIPSLVFSCLFAINYWKCYCFDTTAKSYKDVPSIQTEGWRYCPYEGCAGSVPVNSRHCHQCDVCIIQRDHHCHFTGKCIGQNNLPYFMVLVTALFAVSVTFCTSNFIYIVTHETPGTFIITVVAPIQLLLFFFGYVTFTHFLISLNIIISLAALIGSVVVIYHEYNLLFHNKPILTKSMPIASSGVLAMSKLERIQEVFGKKWYMFYISPVHRYPSQKQPRLVTKDM